MAYSDFTLEKVQKLFNLVIQENQPLFQDIQSLEPSPLLQAFLAQNANLALKINTEKARSEMIIAPILLDLKNQITNSLSLFSGVDFNVDAQQGLNGICDFLISASREQLFIKSPIITLVEAKKENIMGGLGQCVAEMVAAQIFNQQADNQIPIILGVVTSGNIWKFLQLQGKECRIDLNEYYLKDISKILGILNSAVNTIPQTS
jgi:hypothetical protein